MGVNLAFAFHVYKDIELAYRLVPQIRAFYPDVDALCISDGIEYPEFAQFCRQWNVQFQVSDRVKIRALGGKWLERMFANYLAQSDADYLIKVDPDSFLHRPFSCFPDYDLFGAIRLNEHGILMTRGGCVGHRREAIVRILESKLLQDPEYCNSHLFSYRRYSRFRQPGEHKTSQFISHADSILGDIAQRLRLQVGEWQDVSEGVRFRETVPENADLRWAVTHPVLLKT